MIGQTNRIARQVFAVVFGADQALWLAQFPAPSDSWNQTGVEPSLLVLARRCGLQLADLRELFGRIYFKAQGGGFDHRRPSP